MTKNDFPYIVFRAANRYFTLNSGNVMAIMEMPQVEFIPEAPNGVRGIFMFRGDAAPVLDLRVALNESTLERTNIDFTNMLETHKHAHLNWVNTLKKSVEEHEPFTLATDPHQCAFGKWYDSYQTDNLALSHHLKKLETPHRLLHETAIEIENCKANNLPTEALEEILQRAENDYVKTVVGLLDEAITVFKNSFREMALVLNLNGKHCALAVDEVLSVDELSEAAGKDSIDVIAKSSLVAFIKQSERYPGSLILELDETALAAYFGV